MRTTIDLADDVLAAARALATAEGRSLSTVVSRLARRGLASTGRVTGSALPTFAVPDGAPAMGLDDVHRALDDS
ncbi:MAG: antitoxin [Acidimicrobiales bacterium]